MIGSLGHAERLKLTDNRVKIRVRITLREHVGEIRSERRLAECGAKVFERVVPTIVDATFSVILDAARDKLLARGVTSAAHDQSFGLAWPRVMHVRKQRGSDR